MTHRNNAKLNMKLKCIVSLLLTFGIFLSSLPVRADAAVPVKKTLTLKACVALAIQNSSAIESVEDSIESKKAAYDSAVKAINLKQISMSQFRWSPLLNFKFPTSPNFAEASEFQYKPVSIQYEINVAQHLLQDKNFEVAEKVNNLYVEIVVLQETISFNENRLETLKEGLVKNEAKLRLGEANKSDVDKISKKVETLNNKVASDRRSLEADLKKLGKMIGADVSTGYSFEKPFVEAEIERSSLPALIQYTEDRDQTYYEACINETTAKAELTTNQSLMRNKFGGDYNIISSYVTTALNGGEVNKKAFKSAYKSFLAKIDSYWNGKKRIIFVKIPRLWFKGDMDGTRYIDDDPYVLYQNVLDYSGAYNDKLAAKDDLDQNVTDTFNNYISVRNSYKQYIKDVDSAKESLKKSSLLNRSGQLTFEEYDSEMESYEELQNSMLDAMKLYTTTLYSFDRLTCGGISALLTGTDADLQTAVVGESYVEKNTAEGAYYTLKSIIQNQEFELSVYIPDDFEISISDYELWVDNQLIGEKKAIDQKLRHLALVMDAVTEVKIRLYDGDKFIDDCIIDPSSESGPLTITTGFDIKKVEANQIGTYLVTPNETTGLVEISFTMDDANIKSFMIRTDDGKALGGDTAIDIKKSLTYISIINDSLSELTIEFYDEAGSVLYTARFDTANAAVLKKEEE